MEPNPKTVEDYLRLLYTIQLRQHEDGTFFAGTAELPGCMTEADTAEEALAMIRDAMAGWIEVALSEGIPIPEPAAHRASSVTNGRRRGRSDSSTPRLLDSSIRAGTTAAAPKWPAGDTPT